MKSTAIFLQNQAALCWFCAKVDFCIYGKIESQQGAQNYPLSYKKKGVNFHIFARLPMFQYEILQKLPIRGV